MSEDRPLIHAALSGSLAWSGERRGRAKMGGCRVGRDDDDGDGDCDGRFCRQAWRTYAAQSVNLLAARMKSNGVASAIRLAAGAVSASTVAAKRVCHIGIDIVTLILHVSLHKHAAGATPSSHFALSADLSRTLCSNYA